MITLYVYIPSFNIDMLMLNVIHCALHSRKRVFSGIYVFEQNVHNLVTGYLLILLNTSVSVAYLHCSLSFIVLFLENVTLTEPRTINILGAQPQ